MEVSFGDLPLLWGQEQISDLSKGLQSTQSGVLAAMCIAGQLKQEFRRLRAMAINVGKPAQLTGSRANVRSDGCGKSGHGIKLAAPRAPAKVQLGLLGRFFWMALWAYLRV